MKIVKQHFSSYELILVDDGSTDKTIAQCIPFIHANPSIKLLAFSKNYGHKIASTAGFDHATGEVIILMDTDLQHPPELIPKLFEKIPRRI